MFNNSSSLLYLLLFRAEKFNYEYDDFVVDGEFEQWQKEKREIKMKKIEKMEEIIYEKIKIKKDKRKRRSGKGAQSTDSRRPSISSIGTDEGKYISIL